MATKKSPEEMSVETLMNKLDKKYSTFKETEFVKSNLLSMDIVMGGKGIPLGKTIDICSESGLGKSTLLLHVAKNLCDQGYKCIWIDSECALDDSILNGIDNPDPKNHPVGPLMEHKNEKNFLLYTTSSFAGVEEILDSFMPTKQYQFIFIDSLTNITSESRLSSTVYDKDAVSIDKVQVASDARLQSLFMKKYKAMSHETGVTIFFVSQQRTYINMGYGGKPSGATRAGGKAIKYNLDCMLDLINGGEIKEKRETINGTEEIKIGRNILLCITEKCRFGPGNVKVPGVIYYGKGFSNASTLRRFMEIKQVADGNKLKPMLSNSGRSYTLILGDEKIKLDGGENVKNYIKDNFDKILTYFDSSDFALIKEDFQEAVSGAQSDDLSDDFEFEYTIDAPSGVSTEDFDDSEDVEITVEEDNE